MSDQSVIDPAPEGSPESSIGGSSDRSGGLRSLFRNLNWRKPASEPPPESAARGGSGYDGALDERARFEPGATSTEPALALAASPFAGGLASAQSTSGRVPSERAALAPVLAEPSAGQVATAPRVRLLPPPAPLTPLAQRPRFRFQPLAEEVGSGTVRRYFSALVALDGPAPRSWLGHSVNRYFLQLLGAPAGRRALLPATAGPLSMKDVFSGIRWD